MKIIRWLIFVFPVLSVVVVSLLVREHAAKAAAPQTAPTPAIAGNASPTIPILDTAALAIPSTTLAINSTSQCRSAWSITRSTRSTTRSTHTVNASEVLTYHNLTGQALDHFPFHLYQNAFQPNSTFVREAKVAGNRDTSYEKWDPKEYGSEEIKSLEVVGQGDLTSNLQYIQPDDGNKDDKTVVDLRLAKPIAAGEYVQFKIAFQTQVSRDASALGMEARFRSGRPMVSESWRLVAWSVELPSVSRDDGILRRLRRVRREADGAAV